jgi:hypothetical protein
MAMSDANYQIHFANIGAMVELYNQLEADRAAVITTIEEAIALLKDNEAEVTALAGLLATQKSIDSALQNAKRLVSGNIQAYLLGPVAKGIGFTGASLGLIDVLAALAADMALVPESINGSAVSATAPTYPTANAGTFALSTPASLAQLLASESWVAECVSISAGAGHEVWQVRGEPDLHGVLRSNLTSAVAYTGQDRNLQALFAATLTPYTAGTGYKISGDAGALLSAWALTGAVKGTNTDANGDLYLDVVDDTGGYRHVDIWKDSARTQKVGHTATYNTTGAKAIVADGASGLGGTVTVAIVAGTETDLRVRVGFAVAVGDKAHWTSANDAGGVFSEFFRSLGVALPVDLAAGETILDSLAT